ncbi:hypothetical protein I350_05726 [Cryptococcus amylolentus CBS 6273]|uniref:Uncharacterized protein n=1 Tax=Cryptococcus amylolentus CBS 6273 TaxID=1296118 RepID=A0A1E3JPV5_9TREE|nr:hypothetical protein I350_05726 [Cryptococcus amylolentus CBS 6273]
MKRKLEQLASKYCERSLSLSRDTFPVGDEFEEAWEKQGRMMEMLEEEELSIASRKLVEATGTKKNSPKLSSSSVGQLGGGRMEAASIMHGTSERQLDKNNEIRPTINLPDTREDNGHDGPRRRPAYMMHIIHQSLIFLFICIFHTHNYPCPALPLVHLGAAVVAGIMTSTHTNPIWVVKTRLRFSAKRREIALVASAVGAGKGAGIGSGGVLPKPIAKSAAALSTGSVTVAAPVAIAAKPSLTPATEMTMGIIQKKGFRGLYKVLSASYLGVSESVVQWVLYEVPSPTPPSPLESQPLLSYIPHLVGASGGAKAVASLITYPHEAIRTRIRQPIPTGTAPKYTGLLQTLKVVMREEGVRSLYGGLTAHMFRVVPHAACMFLIYELVAAKLGA